MRLDSEKPKIMVIDPPTGIYYRDDRCQARSDDIVTVVVRPPMNLSYIATILEKGGAECFVKDYSLEHSFGDWHEFKKDIMAFVPDVVLFNVTTPSIKYDLITAKIVKEISRKILVVGRGIHFSIYDELVLKENADLDAVVRGEFEATLAEWIQKKTFHDVCGITYRDGGRIIRNGDRPFIENMDEIPTPDRKWLANERFVRADTGEPEATIRTSKGCPYSCIYCLAQFVSGKKPRMRSPKLIVNEIEDCVQNYGINNFLFRSDLFTLSSDWVYEICDEIKARGIYISWACNSRVDTIDEKKLERMRASGCWAIGMGVESGNEESLIKMKKNLTLKQSEEGVRLCRKAGIKAFTYFLIGFPWETKKHIEDTINFAIKLGADLAQFSPLYPYPGTVLNEYAKSLGLLKDEDLHPYALVKPVMGTLYLSMEEIEEYLRIAWKRFYLRPSYISKTLWNARSPRKIMNYIQFGCRALIKLNRNKHYNITNQ